MLMFVLERCCLQKRRVNQIRSAFPELHPPSGLKVLTRRFVLVVVLVLESSRAETWSHGVAESWSGRMIGSVSDHEMV